MYQERTDWVDTPKPPAKPGETPVKSADILRWERAHAEAHEQLDGRLSEATLNATYARPVRLTVQPARRLFDKLLIDVGNRPIVGVSLGASTWEGSSADANRQMSVLLEKMLQASYNPPSISGGYTTKARNGTWVKAGSTGEVLDVDTKKVAVLNAGATATHASYQLCTGIDITYPSGPGIGAWTISIDGGAPVTVTPATTASHVGVWRSPVLTRGKHTFKITALADNAQIGIAYIRDQDEKAGIRLLNFGRAGGATTQFVDASADSTWERITSIVPDFGVLMLGHNNIGRTTPEQFKADLGIICDRLTTAAKRPIWIAVIAQHSTTDQWLPFATAAAEFAATRPSTVTFHSFREFFPSNVTDAAASGEFIEDNLHLNNFGHAIAADVLADSIGLPSRRTWPAVPATEAPPSVDPAVPDITSGLQFRWIFDGLGLADGARVTSVPAASGSAINAPLDNVHATTTRQPTVHLAAQGGHDALRFSRADQQYIRTALFAELDKVAQPATIVTVAKRATTAAAGTLVTGGVVSSQGQHMTVGAESTTSEATFSAQGGGSTFSHPAAPDTNWHVVAGIYDGSTSRGYVDGVAANGTVTNDVNGILPRVTLGSNAAATSAYLDGELLEVRVYKRALSDAEYQYLRTQLATRYALT
ncbi:hypothetical protein GS810_01570 [Rhodococcus hoagii]|nr:hypothetical protein [Prescottella equi]